MGNQNRTTQAPKPANAFDMVRGKVAAPTLGTEWTVDDVQRLFPRLNPAEARNVLLAARDQNVVQELDGLVLDALQKAATDLFGPEKTEE